MHAQWQSLNYLLAFYERDLKVIVDGSLKAWAQKRKGWERTEVAVQWRWMDLGWAL